jgi:hypothetical protein
MLCRSHLYASPPLEPPVTLITRYLIHPLWSSRVQAEHWAEQTWVGQTRVGMSSAELGKAGQGWPEQDVA